MRLIAHRRGPVSVVELDGELNSHTAPEVLQQLDELVPGDRPTLLDMSATSYLSSAGLRVLLLTHRRAAGSGTRLAISGLSTDVRSVMAATGFLDYFTVVESVDAGVAALAG